MNDIGSYDANVLGLAHGRQAEATHYHAVVGKDADAFHNATEPVAKAYLELARETFRDE